MPCDSRETRTRTDLCNGQVDSIGERCNDKATIQAHVLVPIAEFTSTLPNGQFIRLVRPVESQLTLPFEFSRIQYTKWHRRRCSGCLSSTVCNRLPVTNETIDDIFGMDVDDQYGVKFLSIVTGQGISNLVGTIDSRVRMFYRPP